MTINTPRNRILLLRALALQNVRTGYEPHQAAIRSLSHVGIQKIGHDARRIDALAWHYRRQISAELWPVPAWAVAALHQHRTERQT